MSIYNAERTLNQLKDFQRDTAEWVFKRLFDEENQTDRFLVADEVGLGKTIVAKGVVALVLKHLQSLGDSRHDIVYICSNSSIARQNIKKLVPNEVSPLDNVERLTMLAVAELDEGNESHAGINLLAISPGTSFAFGRSTGKFQERALAYTFVRELWGEEFLNSPQARKIFWSGVDDGERKLKERYRQFKMIAKQHLLEFEKQICIIDNELMAQGLPTLKTQFEKLTSDLKFSRGKIPSQLSGPRSEVIGAFRRALATLGINMLKPDLIILDEFQRFKDLMDPASTDWASTLARQLFSHYDEESGRGTKVLLLSATPYRMYARSGESDDHFADFLNTCSFLFQDQNDVKELRKDFSLLRLAMTNTSDTEDASFICARIQKRLSFVMARTERLGVTPDRNGMLVEHIHLLPVSTDDLHAYARIGNISSGLKQGEPIDYWKSSPYLFNFMDDYKLKSTFKDALHQRTLPSLESLAPGPGFLDWSLIENYQPVDAQNARLRWLIEDLHSHQAFDLLWIPPSLRYYDSGSIYESEAATSFTKRVIFSGWAVVPKAVASLTSYEAERQAFRGSRHKKYVSKNRGDGRLTFKMKERKPNSMNTFALMWPSPALAQLGEHRCIGSNRSSVSEIRRQVADRITKSLDPIIEKNKKNSTTDQRWYWLAPLLLDQREFPEATDEWWAQDTSESAWSQEKHTDGFVQHSWEAWETLNNADIEIGSPPDDLIDVLTDLAIGGPSVCALRALSAVSGLPLTHTAVLDGAALVSDAYRRFFNEAEVTAIVLRDSNSPSDKEHASEEGYWRTVLRYCTDAHMQAVLDEHVHTLRDWLGFSSYADESKRAEAATQFAEKINAALSVRAANFGVDIPNPEQSGSESDRKTMRANFAAAYGQRTDDEKSANRNESLSAAFNSPFWPFVLVSTSIGQEGLDFHLWSHAVVHWNLPSNPVDLEQREGRVHRYKGHVVRKNIAETLASSPETTFVGDIWDALFKLAAEQRRPGESELVPYWIYPQGSAKIERHIPLLPFSREASELPRLKNSLAAYRLAFGQPRQEDLVEFLRRNYSESDTESLIQKFQINLTPPAREISSSKPG
jgi:hypothetical protein